MKKALILTLAALMLLGTAAFATQTRVMTMGEANNIVLDEANIWLYPSRINMYPNIALGEIGYTYDYYNEHYTGDLGQFGIHWKFNEKNPWVLGTYFYDASQRGTSYYGSYYAQNGGNYLGLGNTSLPFRIPVSLDPIDYGWFDIPSTPTYNEENQRLSLFYGRKLGGMPFGFYFSEVQSSWKDEYLANKSQRGLSEYDLGFGLTDAAGKWDIAAGLDMLSWSNKTTYVDENGTGVAQDVTKPKGNYNLHVMGRLFHVVNPQWTIVPNAGILIGKYEAEFWSTGATPAVTYTEKFGVASFWGGIGANYTPSANVLVVGEVGLGYTALKEDYTPATTSVNNPAYTDKYKYFTLPYFKIGLEGKVFDWMDVRLGATSYWQHETDDYTAAPEPNPQYPGKSKYNYPSNATYFGTGMHFGNFHIDTQTDPQIFLKGFNFISGGQTVDLNFRVSVLYDFK